MKRWWNEISLLPTIGRSVTNWVSHFIDVSVIRRACFDNIWQPYVKWLRHSRGTPYQHNFLCQAEIFSTDCVIGKLTWNLGGFTFCRTGRSWKNAAGQSFARLHNLSPCITFRNCWLAPRSMTSAHSNFGETRRTKFLALFTQTKAKELAGLDLCRSPPELGQYLGFCFIIRNRMSEERC